MTRRLVFAAILALASLLSSIAHAQPTVIVRGDNTCPTAEMIGNALASARPAPKATGSMVTVEVADGKLLLSLGEAPTVRREIPADPDCSVRAESVAVVIAAWSGELDSRPADSPVLTVSTPAPVLAPAPRPSHVIELDGAGFYSLQWGHAPGASLAVARTRRQGGLGARVLGGYQFGRDVTLEGGSNQVLRFLLAAAASYDLQLTRLFAAGDVGLLGTLTRAQGSGYARNQSESVTNFGGLADVRVGVRLGRFRLWSNARVLRLVHGESVKIDSTSPGVADSAKLSAWDLHLGAGLGYRFE